MLLEELTLDEIEELHRKMGSYIEVARQLDVSKDQLYRHRKSLETTRSGSGSGSRVDEHAKEFGVDTELYYPRKIFTSETNNNLRVEWAPKTELLSSAAMVPELSNLPEWSISDSRQTRSSEEYLLNLTIPDVHLGNVATEWELSSKDEERSLDEVFQESIATTVMRYQDALLDLVAQAQNYSRDKIDRISYTIGNDFFNVDNIQRTTTAGTPQTNTSFHLMYRHGLGLLRWTVDYLRSQFPGKPIDLLLVPGNHDYTVAFTAAEALKQIYDNDSLVNVNNSPNARKYIHWGKTLIMLTHGHKEKTDELRAIMERECGVAYHEAKIREILTGHLHGRSIKPIYRVTHRYLPSLAGNNSYHQGEGHHVEKAAEAFLYTKSGNRLASFLWVADE